MYVCVHYYCILAVNGVVIFRGRRGRENVCFVGKNVWKKDFFSFLVQ